jgi:hypothetical protein
VKPQIASAAKIIHAPAEVVYHILADFRNQHPHILPKQYFQSLEVEEGGFGEGTITRFQMRLLGQTQRFRTLITEPQPGRVLVETDTITGTPTTFTVTPLSGEARTRVTIATELKNRGAVEAFIGRLMLQKVYQAELDLLARRAEEQAASQAKSNV